VILEKLGGKAFYDLCQEDIEEYVIKFLTCLMTKKSIRLGIAMEWKTILLRVWRDLHQLSSRSGSDRSPQSIRNPEFWRDTVAQSPPVELTQVISPPRARSLSLPWSPLQTADRSLPLSPISSYSDPRSGRSTLPSIGAHSPSIVPDTPLRSVIISAPPPPYQTLSPMSAMTPDGFSDIKSDSGRSERSYASMNTTSTTRRERFILSRVEEENVGQFPGGNATTRETTRSFTGGVDANDQEALTSLGTSTPRSAYSDEDIRNVISSLADLIADRTLDGPATTVEDSGPPPPSETPAQPSNEAGEHAPAYPSNLGTADPPIRGQIVVSVDAREDSHEVTKESLSEKEIISFEPLKNESGIDPPSTSELPHQTSDVEHTSRPPPALLDPHGTHPPSHEQVSQEVAAIVEALSGENEITSFEPSKNEIGIEPPSTSEHPSQTNDVVHVEPTPLALLDLHATHPPSHEQVSQGVAAIVEVPLHETTAIPNAPHSTPSGGIPEVNVYVGEEGPVLGADNLPAVNAATPVGINELLNEAAPSSVHQTQEAIDSPRPTLPDELEQTAAIQSTIENGAAPQQASQSEDSFHSVPAPDLEPDVAQPGTPLPSPVLQPSPPPEYVSEASRPRRDSRVHGSDTPQATPMESGFPSYLANAEVYSTSVSINVEGASDGQSECWEDMISDNEGNLRTPLATRHPRSARTATSTWPTTTEASGRRTRRSRHSRHPSYPLGVDVERIETILQASMQRIARLTQRIEGIEGRLEDLERMLHNEEEVSVPRVPSITPNFEDYYSREITKDYRESAYLRAGAVLVGMSMLMGASHLARRGLI
jgi:hypothetical protein